jgi:sn-glycerol 3-phosphate transport system ATP-binding protein
LATIVLEGLRKVYPGKPPVVAVEDLDLTIDDGELVAFVGPSGCGKSTVLRCVAGLEKLTAGRVIIGGREVQELPPGKRDIAMVFQSYALYPHLTVYKNLAFPLKERHVPRQRLDVEVRRVAEMLEITPLLKRRPGQLSGGQRQRVAMGRALVREPQAFLLDEPLSNLDAKLRTQMRTEIADVHRRLRITSIYVTHDQIEAMTLGQRIVVMRDGRVQQAGRPSEVYDNPANLFVAGFLGTPTMNLLTGKTQGGVLTAGALRMVVPGAPDANVVVGIRPEGLSVAEDDGGPSIDIVVTHVEALGNENLVHGHIDDVSNAARPLVLRAPPRILPQAESRIRVRVDPAQLLLFDETTEQRVALTGPVTAGDRRVAG